jgi:FtsH-binding integral membrane protein
MAQQGINPASLSDLSPRRPFSWKGLIQWTLAGALLMALCTTLRGAPWLDDEGLRAADTIFGAIAGGIGGAVLWWLRILQPGNRRKALLGLGAIAGSISVLLVLVLARYLSEGIWVLGLFGEALVPLLLYLGAMVTIFGLVVLIAVSGRDEPPGV